MDRRNIRRLTVTLHVGPGTFLPVRTENVEDHVMQEEDFSIDAATSEVINRERPAGAPLLAVGTTTIRVLESAWECGRIRSGEGSTRIFIYPGYKFRAVDLVFTNFHTPESTLFMLVSAFGGTDLIRKAYREAVEARYGSSPTVTRC
jgi:S-adenosylmethionine:tRNA ribosyltransferase-isomerase